MNVFIIGAGFTRAVFPDAPLNGDLLDALSKKDHDSVASDLRDRYKTNDVEIALTRLDTEIADQISLAPACSELRVRIETELGNYFGSGSPFVASKELLSKLPWLAALVDGAFSTGDVVISLNYDCVLEGILDCCRKWSPNGGYGSSFNQLLMRVDCPNSPVTVLKIHGSASFVIAPYGDNPNASAVGFVFNSRLFPHSAEHSDFGYGAGTGRSYLIAPSYVKVPTVEICYLMLDALGASASATNLIVIGSALRPEDGFLMVILTNFLRHSSGRAFILDLAANDIASRLQNFWGLDVASRIVPIEAPLNKASVGTLVELLRTTVKPDH